MTDRVSPLDAPWETVDLMLVYLDGGKIKQRDVHLVRAEVEATERANAIDEVGTRFAGLDPESEERAEALQRVKDWTLTPEEFQGRVMSNVENMIVAPLRVRDVAVPNGFRVLAPWAIQEVRVVVNAEQQRSPLILPMN